MKKFSSILMAGFMLLCLSMSLTSCGVADNPAPIMPGVPTADAIAKAKVLGAALEVGATVSVNYTVGTSTYTATFKKNSDDSYTLISNTKISAARAATRGVDPAYTVPTGDGDAVGSNIQLTLVGDKLVLSVKDSAGTPLFEAQMSVDGGEVVVVNTNAAGIDCTIGSVSVNDQVKDIKNPEMESIIIEMDPLKYVVKYIEGETWADVIKRNEGIDLVEVLTTGGYISVKFSKELVVKTLIEVKEWTEANAEAYYTEYLSGLFYLITPIATTRGMTRSVAYNYIKVDDLVSTFSTYSLTPKTPELAVPLTLEALSAGTIVVNEPKSGMQYSLNGGAKTAVSGDITVAIGDKVAFYGDGTNIASYSGTTISGGTAEVKVYGNIMSLVDVDRYGIVTELTEASAFNGLFSGNTTLKDASGLLLPATTLSDFCYNCMFLNCTSLTTAPAQLHAPNLTLRCYQGMFSGCSSLLNAPELPAMTLAEYCYQDMFFNCSSLTTAPVLPAPTLVTRCYTSMFNGCTSLNTVTCLATDISASKCTISWLLNVSSTGTFIKASGMTSWTTGSNGIPSGWGTAQQ